MATSSVRDTSGRPDFCASMYVLLYGLWFIRSAYGTSANSSPFALEERRAARLKSITKAHKKSSNVYLLVGNLSGAREKMSVTRFWYSRSNFFLKNE